MYGGQIVERAEVEDLFYRPRMPYTWGLLNSIPSHDAAERRRLEPIPGAPPLMSSPPPGCRFAPRCSFKLASCDEFVPELVSMSNSKVHEARCSRVGEVGFANNAPTAHRSAETAR
jgi:oligopeptide transport system ATP-binding protein